VAVRRVVPKLEEGSGGIAAYHVLRLLGGECHYVFFGAAMREQFRYALGP
jgi:ribosomal protein S27AE